VLHITFNLALGPNSFSQALHLLPTNNEVPLSALILTAYVPVPDTNGEEWDRLEPASALDAIVELVLHGEYNGVIGGAAPTKHALELRAAALHVFEVCLIVPPDTFMSLEDIFSISFAEKKRS
jgi:hypothetical protein